MEHNLFKPKTFDEAKNSVVGDCNGFSMAERWEKETPLFAKEILKHLPADGTTILDYGCGCGRLAKEILKQNSRVTVIGVDASDHELKLAKEYINDSRFIPMRPEELDQSVDLAYCVYVLQHAPAIEIRDILYRIHTYLKDDGKFVYCSSDFRMAIRFDGGGFYDDRHLGVNLQEEVGRVFKRVGDLFQIFENPVIEKMVTGKDGGLAHPAIVFQRRNDIGHVLNFSRRVSDSIKNEEKIAVKEPMRLILRNRLSPGDCLVMSVAIRALHKAHPGKFFTDVDTPCNDIYRHSPYITPLSGSGQIIDMQYPEIHQSGASGRHFVEGHRKFLEEKLSLEIPRDGMLPDIFLSQDEILWPSPIIEMTSQPIRYWVINAGSKKDYTLKQYHRYQEVVNLLKDKIQFVQVGQMEHLHPPLEGVIDMRGKTDIRKLFRLIYHADGVLTCVSFHMHIAAALKKPCVVVAGGREGTRWELYPNHRFLYTNGALRCCTYDGCWKSKLEECADVVKTDKGKTPRCMEIITPEMIMDNLLMYYRGGILEPIEEGVFA